MLLLHFLDWRGNSRRQQAVYGTALLEEGKWNENHEAYWMISVHDVISVLQAP